jgi:hypothetical protein
MTWHTLMISFHVIISILCYYPLLSSSVIIWLCLSSRVIIPCYLMLSSSVMTHVMISLIIPCYYLILSSDVILCYQMLLSSHVFIPIHVIILCYLPCYHLMFSSYVTIWDDNIFHFYYSWKLQSLCSGSGIDPFLTPLVSRIRNHGRQFTTNV